MRLQLQVMSRNTPTQVPPSLRGYVVAEGYRYWASKLQAGRLPGRRDLDPLDIPDLLPQVALLDVQRVPWDFRFRLVGTGVVAHLGGDLTGQWMSGVGYLCEPSGLFETCRQVASLAAPRRNRRPSDGPLQQYFDAEDMVLPLAADGETPDMLLLFAEYVPKANVHPEALPPC